MKLYLHILLFMFLSGYSLTNVTGQSLGYPVHKFTLEDGLEYGILKVFEDAKGIIWLMNSYSIQRFDGSHTDTWFKGERIHSLFVDSRGEVWCSTQKGIFRFDRKSNRFLEIASEETATSVKIIFEADETRYYISTSGISVYNDDLGRFVISDLPSQQLNIKTHINIRKFSHAEQTLYYQEGNAIWRHNIQTGNVDKVLFKRIRNVVALSEKEIIVSSWESTSCWYYNFETQQRSRLSVSGTDPFLVVYDSTGAIDDNSYYLATFKGLMLYETATNDLSPVALSYQGNLIPAKEYIALCKGSNGIIWMCSNGNVLNFNPFKEDINFIQSDPSDPGLQFNHSARHFAEDEEGNLWLATIGGLAYWNAENKRFSTIRAEEDATDRLNHISIRGLAYDGTYLIIGQTDKGVWLYNPKTKTWRSPQFEDNEEGRSVKQKIENAFIYQIKTLKNGDHIISGAGKGAYVMDGKTYAIKAIDFPDFTPHVKFSYQDSKGNIFIGTLQNGFYCFDASLNYQYQVKEPLESPWVHSIVEWDDDYYIGTSKGLYFFSGPDNSSGVKKAIPELKDHSIRVLFKDNKETLWIATESKLHQYFPETKQLITYGYSENVRGEFFYPNGYIRKSDGQVFIGAHSGINYFYPEKIAIYPRQLNPYIREAAIEQFTGIINSFEETIRLNRHQNTVNINFSTPYYGNPDDIKYRYQLTENGPWINIGNQSSITLGELVAGNYRFRVAATLYDGIWHTSENTFRFTIPPPFWQTWWFIVIMVILGSMIVYRAFMSLRQKLKIERLLNVFTTSIYGHNTVEGILWDTAGNCVKQLGFTDCVIYELDKRKKVLLQKAAAGSKNPYNREIINAMEIPLGKGITGAVAASGKPLRIGNTEKEPQYIEDTGKALSEIAVPIWIDGEVFGVIDSQHAKRNFYTRYHLRLLEKIAGLCADRIRKYLTEEELRGKISRRLHDDMGSTLTNIHIISEMSEQRLKEDAPLKKQLARISRHASDMMEKMNDMVWVVNPANDGLDKLIYKIREYAAEVLEPKDIGLSFQELEEAKYIKLTPDQRENIYLIAKEALNNAIKYSDASRVTIAFTRENNTVRMQISDNGKGYDPSVAHNGNGVKNMHIRSEDINATLKIETAPGKGVLLVFSLTVERKQLA